MNPLDFFALLGMVTTPAAIVFGIAWYTTKRELDLRKELTREPREGLLSPARGTDAGQLAQAMDAIAIEVERIAEGQRFVTKLLAERGIQERGAGEQRQAALPPRVVTPH